MELNHISDAETLFKYWGWIKKMDNPMTSPEMVVSRILSGRYMAFLPTYVEPKGIVIYEALETTFNVIWIYMIPGELREFPGYLWGVLKEKGFTKARAISSRSQSGFEKLTGLTKVYSTYEREL